MLQDYYDAAGGTGLPEYKSALREKATSMLTLQIVTERKGSEP